MDKVCNLILLYVFCSFFQIPLNVLAEVNSDFFTGASESNIALDMISNPTDSPCDPGQFVTQPASDGLRDHFSFGDNSSPTTFSCATCVWSWAQSEYPNIPLCDSHDQQAVQQEFAAGQLLAADNQQAPQPPTFPNFPQRILAKGDARNGAIRVVYSADRDGQDGVGRRGRGGEHRVPMAQQNTTYQLFPFFPTGTVLTFRNLGVTSVTIRNQDTNTQITVAPNGTGNLTLNSNTLMSWPARFGFVLRGFQNRFDITAIAP